MSVAMGLTSKLLSSIRIKMLIIRTQMVLENTFKEIIKCYNAAIHANFPHHLYSHRPGGDGGTPLGPGAASAESCTHPAKRDRCFSPPIVERQRLPNVGIQYALYILSVVFV